MKLPLKGQYGVRAAFSLSMRFGEGPLSLKSIAEEQSVPEAFLEQILQSLKRAGIVATMRGARGGYMLARSPGDVAIGDILAALDVRLSPVECLDSTPCERQDLCAMRLVYERIGKSTMKIVNETTLMDMIHDHERLLSKDEPEEGNDEIS